jgi:DtxR family Mn-dependent transcriptional regulator
MDSHRSAVAAATPSQVRSPHIVDRGSLATETVENYLKAIFTLCRESPTGEAGMSRIAAAVGVTTGTATSMVKKLGAAKLARYERFGGVSLTAKGTRAAVDILRRHRLVETFLVETLRLDWSVVHQEAERLEHALSPVVIEALDRHLGHPAFDPHGDPIPRADGSLLAPGGQPLHQFPAGSRLRVVRITDQGAAFLKFIGQHALRPGCQILLARTDHDAQALLVQATDADPVSIAFRAAEKIRCERVEAVGGNGMKSARVQRRSADDGR